MPFRGLARTTVVLLALSGASATLAAPAGAATLKTEFPCYFEEKVINWNATELGPSADYQVTLDGTEVASGKAGTDGTAQGSLTSADLPRGAGEKRFVLAITAGTSTAMAPFRVSEFNADFTPSSGDPTTLLVRFSVFGFGARKTIFLHYLRPGTGAVARTVRLGRVKGVCGKIKRTKQRHLFPFKASSGEWRLQFDTRRVYKPGAQPAVVRRVRIAAH